MKKSETAKRAAVVTAASPVRAPSRMPVADSMYAPLVDVPRSAQIANLHRHRFRFGDDSRFVETDEREKEPDTDREAVLQARRDRVRKPGAQSGERDHQKNETADEDRAEALLPGDAEGGEAEG